MSNFAVCVNELPEYEYVIFTHGNAWCNVLQLAIYTWCNVLQLACKMVAIVLHYFCMCVFAWMFVDALHIYRMMTEIRDINHGAMKFYYVVGYGQSLTMFNF